MKKDWDRERGSFFFSFCFGVVTDLFLSKDLGLKYKVVLQLSRLCLLANYSASTITDERGGGEGGGCF